MEYLIELLRNNDIEKLNNYLSTAKYRKTRDHRTRQSRRLVITRFGFGKGWLRQCLIVFVRTNIIKQIMIWLESIATFFGFYASGLPSGKTSVLANWPNFKLSFLSLSFYYTKLYSDLILHMIYVVMQIYGWYIASWRK